ncbi:ABC transporter substrate-binding protein [Microvirga sp. M2]|uniref:ABC transporter substrate-binding protein n=1 Tax=Microvirga sp. M2 TaxID=3073270 RepID=UPI0039C42AC3
MNRRDFIAVMGGAATWPLTANAQMRTPTVGVLWHAGSAQEEEVYLSVMQKAFRDLGYVEGRNIELLHRFPAETPALFERFAKELAGQKLDAIIAVTARSAREVKRATNTIPTVFVVVPDPIGTGLVDNLARPRGNLTGLSLIVIDLSGKRLEFLKEAIGPLTRVGLLADLIEPAAQSFLTASQKAAAALGVSTVVQEAAIPDDIAQAFARFREDGVDAAILGPGPMLFNERARIGHLALTSKLPILVNVAEMLPHGALMSYGQDFPEFFRRAVSYVDRILKGARVEDLPVEQPTRLKLTINVKAARGLSLTIPETLLARADEVIE